jgi:hypothetical protein
MPVPTGIPEVASAERTFDASIEVEDLDITMYKLD